MPADQPKPSGLRHEADPQLQDQAAREQEIERVQLEVDAHDVDAEPPEPEDAIDLPSQERVFEMAARRNPRA